MSTTLSITGTPRHYRVNIINVDGTVAEANFPVSIAATEAEAQTFVDALWSTLLPVHRHREHDTARTLEGLAKTMVDVDEARREQMMKAIEARWAWLCALIEVDNVPVSAPMPECLRTADDVLFWEQYSELKSTNQSNHAKVDAIIELMTAKAVNS